MMDFSKSKFDIIGRTRLWITVSVIMMAIGFVGMIRNMVMDGFPLVRGIDFVGGSIVQLQFDDWPADRDVPTFADNVKLLVDEYTERAPQVLTTVIPARESSTGQPGLLLQIRADAGMIENAEAQGNIYEGIRALAGDFTVLEETQVGALIGKELTNKAVLGVFIGLILILIYIWIRLSFDFGVFAVLAMFHDVLVLTGIYALFRVEIDSSFVAVILTVVGYSINDTVVIYDRIRENMKVKRHLRFDVLVNQSLLETMARSINTGMATILAILALLIFGGVSLRMFMMGLAVGITCGTYSSVFVASPLLVWWRMRGKVPSRFGEAAGAVSLIHEDDEDLVNIGEEEEEEEGEGVEAITAVKAPLKPKQKKPKRRRRR